MKRNILILILILAHNSVSLAQSSSNKQFLINCEVSYAANGFAERWTYWYLANKSHLKELKDIKCSDDTCDLLKQFKINKFKELHGEIKGIETLGCCEAGDSNKGISLLKENEERYNHYIDSENTHLSSFLKPYSPIVIPTKYVELKTSTAIYDIKMWVIDSDNCKCKKRINNKLSEVEYEYFISKINKVKKPSRKWAKTFDSYFDE